MHRGTPYQNPKAPKFQIFATVDVDGVSVVWSTANKMHELRNYKN